jgi:cytochrome c556
MSDGNMDIGKMMSSMQSMMSNLNDIVKDKTPSDSAAATDAATVTTDTADIKTLPSEE